MKNTIILDEVDQQLYDCLDPERPKSFFLFAGAGSGKTRSLVNVLKKFREERSSQFLRSGHQVAVITYTNAACDEIRGRLDFDESFSVSTIHSFAWGLIKNHKDDIKVWLDARLNQDIADLEDKQNRGRAGTKAALDRPRQIDAKRRRLELLKNVRKFIYSPNGDNTEWNSLNHAEVISITADFLLNYPVLGRILTQKHPILFIDESQDTVAGLMEAFFQIQDKFEASFTLGLFGDRMQRIYLDGKKDLGEQLPENWVKPEKIINYRCPKRVIKLINQIRSPLDDTPQEAGPNNSEGVVRLFLADSEADLDKGQFENWVSAEMARIAEDEQWVGDNAEVKILTLEHMMAARRGGFHSFFQPLYTVDKFKTGLLNGTLPGIGLFANQVLPLVEAMERGNKFEVTRIVRKHSPLLGEETLKKSDSQIGQIKKANDAVTFLMRLWSDQDPSLNDILENVFLSGLFPIPERFLPIAKRLAETSESQASTEFEEEAEEDRDEAIDAWDEALACRFKNFKGYVNYISDKSRFGTHQGIKGREFPRVMVILDDYEARGFLFSYEKLLGAQDPSDNDRRKASDGEETTIERTRKLFYVTCSRAEKSLAIVAYTADSDRLKSSVITQGLFSEAEVILPPVEFEPEIDS